jgi:predicted amidohydrolase
MTVLRLAAAGLEVAPPAGIGGFRARLADVARQARAGGAEMLLMAEYFAMEVAAGAGPDVAGELARAVELADGLVEAAREVARAHGLWLLPGSFAMAEEVGAKAQRVLNRAPLIAPDGTPHWTEKHRMTRFETEEWGIAPGAHPAPIDTPWGRIGVAVCYDAEFPPITRKLAEAGAFLLLVPASTDTMAGAMRVDISARAAAIQNQCFAAVAPTLGVAPWSAALDTNFGRAAIFGPADRGFPDDGVLAATEWNHPGMVFADLDPQAVARVRVHGAVRNFRDWPAA